MVPPPTVFVLHVDLVLVADNGRLVLREEEEAEAEEEEEEEEEEGADPCLRLAANALIAFVFVCAFVNVSTGRRNLLACFCVRLVASFVWFGLFCLVKKDLIQK